MIRLTSTTIEDKFIEYSKYVLKNGFVFDAENEKQITECINILKSNEFGLQIVGNSGSGKSLFFEMMQKLIHPQSERSFFKINVVDVISDYNKTGNKVFDRWKTKNVCFDDLGVEEMGWYMGKKLEVMEKFIYERHLLYHTKKIKTHFTSNLSKAKIFERYGMRSDSRLDEMCDRIILGGTKKYTDRRKYRNFVGLPDVYHDIKKSEEDIAFEQKIAAAKAYAKNNPYVSESKGLGARTREMYGGRL